MKTIFWIGDSTVQTNKITTYPQTGMGQVLSLYLKEEICVKNHAKNGRSTKSFLDEGRFVPVMQNMGEGDFLFIEFGHNDEKKEDPARYTDPDGTFRENLRFFIRSAQKKQATPVLITPLERRCFGEDGSLGAGAHLPYVEAIRQTAEQEQAALVDLYAMSREALAEAGEASSRCWYMKDNTHLKYEGAVFFAGLIAKGLERLGGSYADLLLAEEME